MNMLEILESFHVFRISSLIVVLIKFYKVIPIVKNYTGSKTRKYLAIFCYFIPSSILLILCLLTNHVFFAFLILVEQGVTSFAANKILYKKE